MIGEENKIQLIHQKFNLNSKKSEIDKEIRIARKKMETAAKNLDFLIAAKYRDEIKKLKKLLQSKKTS